MYRLFSRIIQLLLRAFEWYQDKVREEKLESLSQARKELKEKMNNAKNSENLADVVSDWSNDELSVSNSTNKSETGNVDDSSKTNSQSNGE